MALTYTRGRIRLAIDVTRQDPIQDDVTGNSPALWRGTDLGIEIALFVADRGLVDIAQYASITAEVRDAATRTSNVFATKTVPLAEFNQALTADQWQSGDSQHALFAWTSEETRWPIDGALEREFWLVISAITTDPSPRRITLGGTSILLREDGTGEPANTPLPGNPLFLTAEQTAALIGDAVRSENAPGKTILLKSPNGQFGRLIGVDNSGTAFDTIVALT